MLQEIHKWHGSGDPLLAHDRRYIADRRPVVIWHRTGDTKLARDRRTSAIPGPEIHS
jgi:hypothetical protein